MSSRWIALTLTAGLWLAPHLHAQSMAAERTLSGTVTDGREPLKGAVVQVENETTETLVSYVTDKTGHYHFLHLNLIDDYKFSAKFRGRTSKSKRISKFNARTSVHQDLVIRLTR